MNEKDINDSYHKIYTMLIDYQIKVDKLEERIEKIEPLLKYNHEWILQHIQDSIDKEDKPTIYEKYFALEKPKDSETFPLVTWNEWNEKKEEIADKAFKIHDLQKEIERLNLSVLSLSAEKDHLDITIKQMLEFEDIENKALKRVIERALNSMRGIRNEGDKGYYVGSSTIEGWIEILEGKS